MCANQLRPPLPPAVLQLRHPAYVCCTRLPALRPQNPVKCQLIAMADIGRHLPPLVGSVSLAVAALRLHRRSQHYCTKPSIQSTSDTQDSISPRLLQLQSIVICLLQLLLHFFQSQLDFRDLSSHNQSKPARSSTYMHYTSRSRISSSLATISIWSCSACACATCPEPPVTLDGGSQQYLESIELGCTIFRLLLECLPHQSSHRRNSLLFSVALLAACNSSCLARLLA